VGPWQERVGHYEWEEKKGGSGRFQHFTLYFDDAGCIDVIAADVQVLGLSPDEPY